MKTPPKPPPTKTVILLDANRNVSRIVNVPESDVSGCVVVVDGVKYEHVDEEQSGEWRYAPAK
jgi:hypothetical protein